MSSQKPYSQPSTANLWFAIVVRFGVAVYLLRFSFDEAAKGYRGFVASGGIAFMLSGCRDLIEPGRVRGTPTYNYIWPTALLAFCGPSRRRSTIQPAPTRRGGRGMTT
jgi:hypothetical protein